LCRACAQLLCSDCPRSAPDSPLYLSPRQIFEENLRHILAAERPFRTSLSRFYLGDLAIDELRFAGAQATRSLNAKLPNGSGASHSLPLPFTHILSVFPIAAHVANPSWRCKQPEIRGGQ